MSRRASQSALPALLALLVGAAAVRMAAAQEPPAAGAVAPPVAGGEPGFYLGVGSCLGAACHGSTRPVREARVLGNEYYTWLRRDPHQGAYNLLFNEDSRLIAANLRLAEPAHRAALCLDCHALAVPAGRKRGPVPVEDGISCEACHGPASGWRDGHTDPSWTHADSLARGLVDLAEPAVRAAACLACHLGDGRRAVDHELIASGHPALAFELDNFSAEMPPHWQPDAADGVRGWAVGQVVAFRAGLAELARRARSERWPEFAELACTSCHHSLAGDRWRTAAGFPGRVRPGLPAWSPARWAALRHLVFAVAPAERPGLDADVRRLAGAVEPLNRPAEVAAIAEALARALDRVIPAVATARWDEGQARSLLAALAADPEFLRSADLASAEQLFFAAQSLAGHLVRGDPRRAGGPLPARLDRLYRELADPEAYDPGRFSELLREVAAAAGP
jgi:hypothetical protein